MSDGAVGYILSGDSNIKIFGDVKFYYDVKSDFCKNLIIETIKKNGFAPEHNYEYFISHESHEMKPVFVYFGNYEGVFAIEWDDNCYQVLSEILAPENRRCDIAIKFFDIVLNDIHSKKILVEFPAVLRHELLKRISLEKKSSTDSSNINRLGKIKLGRVICKYNTPIINISTWDSALTGSHFSNLRKAKNRFYRNFKVEVITGDDVLKIPAAEFKLVIDSWKKNRKSSDRVFTEYYVSFFENNFRGSACHIALKLNDKLCGVCAALPVPNTNNKTVYYVINLHDYSVQELGDFLTLLFFDELKKEGFEFMDFGSSDEKLFNYKKKFGIHDKYETIVYYVSLEKNDVNI